MDDLDLFCVDLREQSLNNWLLYSKWLIRILKAGGGRKIGFCRLLIIKFRAAFLAKKRAPTQN